MEATGDMIKSVGGQKKWDALPEHEQAERQAHMMEQLVISLGTESYQSLEESEKRILKLFIWVGCGCHKDLNTV